MSDRELWAIVFAECMKKGYNYSESSNCADIAVRHAPKEQE